MIMLSVEEIEAVLTLGYELSHLELKGPGPRTDSHLFAKVARAALGMGNLRDGGQIVIGIDDKEQATMLPGLSHVDLGSWLEHDHVARKLAEYADPPLKFDVAAMALSSGVNVAVLNVYEFSDTPHICARAYEGQGQGPSQGCALRAPAERRRNVRGFVRGRHARSDCACHGEGVTRIRRNRGAVWSTTVGRAIGRGAVHGRARSGLGAVLSAVIDKIRSRGAWDVTVRPATFDSNRVPYEELEQIVAKSAVRMRGWPVPFLEMREPVIHGADWIGQDIDAQMVQHYEAWRFFTSGQFNHLRSISADWRVGTDMSPTPVPAGADSVIEVWEVLFYLTELFELAARLALTPAGAETMVVAARLDGMSNRALVVGQSNRAPFMGLQLATVPSLLQTVTFERDDLIADGHEHAIEMARQFFLRFGWNASRDQLANHQRELLKGS
jgi:hypothetical protein